LQLCRSYSQYQFERGNGPEDLYDRQAERPAPGRINRKRLDSGPERPGADDVIQRIEQTHDKDQSHHPDRSEAAQSYPVRSETSAGIRAGGYSVNRSMFIEADLQPVQHRG